MHSTIRKITKKMTAPTYITTGHEASECNYQITDSRIFFSGKSVHYIMVTDISDTIKEK